MGPGKALVVGDDTRGFLATVRSLGRKGIEVHAAPSNFRSPSLTSRYITAIHDLPPWMGDGGEWLAAMEALLRAQRFDLVVPCDERTLLPLQRHRALLSPLATLAIPSDEAITALFDKHGTRELARRVGVVVAPGRLMRADDTAEGVLAEFGAPVVVKPRRSFTLDGLGTRGRVHLLSDPAELAQALAHSDPDSTLLETCFPGQGLGMSILASNGNLLQVFEHHRVHERSGSSFYRVSAMPDPELVQACAAIAAGVRYTGVGMFEFKRNPQGQWILLEVNARPWGSLPLPVALGVDFPYRWYRLLVQGTETPSVPYRVPVYGRNMVPDLLACVADAQAQNLGPLRFGLFMIGRVFEMLRLATGQEVHDVMMRDDPQPGRAEMRSVALGMLRRIERRLPGGRGRAQARARAAIRLARRGTAPMRVLFVCQGNICRSPFAEAALRARMPQAETGSAGMIPLPGRPTPGFGVQAASQLGLALSSHRSAWLNRATAEAASLIVVFDDINTTAIADRYPDLRTPVVKLGDLIAEGDIADPVDGDGAMFDRTYALIAQGVEALARELTLPSA